MILQLLAVLALAHLSHAYYHIDNYFESFEDSYEFATYWNQTTLSGGNSSSVKRNSGSTDSTGTGPSRAYDGSYYIYYEDSGNDEPALLMSPPFIAGGDCTLSYAYHMNGDTIEELIVAVGESLISRDPLTSKVYKGHQGYSWILASQDFRAPSNPIQIGLMFKGSDSYRGDIALDALQLNCTGSPDPTRAYTTPPPTGAPYTGEGEVRVKFGGAQVDVNIPGFEAVEDIDVVAEGVFSMIHHIMMYPFHLIHYIIHGY